MNSDEIISDDENIAKTFNDLFLNIAKDLNLKYHESLLNRNLDFIENPVLRAIKFYKIILA